MLDQQLRAHSRIRPAALVTLTAALVGFSIAAGGVAPAEAATGGTSRPVCRTSGPITGLSPASAANARVVAATAASRGGNQAALIALTAALTSSSMRVLTNPNDPAGDAFVNQGAGHKQDSLGIFQQHASWGSAAQRMDPVASTNLFMNMLLSVHGWESMSPWAAAQRVQLSAFADGSNFRTQLDLANKILAVIDADAVKQGCVDVDVDGSASSQVGTTDLPAGYAVPGKTSTAARAALAFALSQQGKPYVWAGTGPNSYDCSGLMQRSWAVGGVAISRVTGTQQFDGSRTTSAQLMPGDLVLTPGAHGTLSSPGHVGMYAGDGLVVEAPRPGEVVKVVSYAAFTAGGVSALRHIG